MARGWGPQINNLIKMCMYFIFLSGTVIYSMVDTYIQLNMHRHPSHLYLPLLLFEHSDTAQVYLLISNHCTQVERYIPTNFSV